MRSWESSCLSLSTAWSAPSVPANLHAVVDIGTTPSPLAGSVPPWPDGTLTRPCARRERVPENEHMSPESIASLTTAGGTLVLAVATFSSTRSANRASRIAERSLLASLRPVLVHAELGDPRQKIGYADDHWVHVDGPQAIFEVVAEVIYLAFGLRNVGIGIGIIQACYPYPHRVLGAQQHRPIEEFRAQT